MSKKLYQTGIFFVIAWIIGYVLFAAGAYIHLLFAVAFILFVCSEMVSEKVVE